MRNRLVGLVACCAAVAVGFCIPSHREMVNEHLYTGNCIAYHAGPRLLLVKIDAPPGQAAACSTESAINAANRYFLYNADELPIYVLFSVDDRNIIGFEVYSHRRYT